jgi:hypothetical protein
LEFYTVRNEERHFAELAWILQDREKKSVVCKAKERLELPVI